MLRHCSIIHKSVPSSDKENICFQVFFVSSERSFEPSCLTGSLGTGKSQVGVVEEPMIRGLTDPTVGCGVGVRLDSLVCLVGGLVEVELLLLNFNVCSKERVR